MTGATGDAGHATGLPGFVQAMLDPAFYPHSPDSVQIVQTHISYVLLAGAEVFKLKKPVRFSFLDFSTLDRRRHYCREELRLNRRLTTDVYLEVVSVCADGSGYRLGDEEDEAAVEYAVRMRRLPAERMFSQLLQRGEAMESHVDAIAGRLAEFHERANSGAEVAAYGAPEALQSRLAVDFSESERYRGRTIAPADDRAIQRFCTDFVATHAATLHARQAAGRIREGHGDLRAEHVCFADELQIIDCIEFDVALRCRDVASEVAFLAMDIEFLGHPVLARYLVERYAMHAADADLAFLIPFYECYFAYIRGKVDSLTSGEEEVDEEQRRQAAASATRHFAQSYRYTWAYSPMLIAVVGLSGSGKSTIARALRERTGFTHINSDVVRKQLAGLAVDRPAPLAAKRFLYAGEQSRRTYETMYASARSELAGGRGVIVDATFQRRVDRAAVYDLAREASLPVLIVECRCDEGEIRRRLDARVRSAAGASDADWSVYQAQRERYEEFAEAEAAMRVVVRSTDPPELIVAQIEEAARQRPRQGVS